MPKPSQVPDRGSEPESERRLARPVNATHETVPTRTRRVFSAADKLRIVKEAESCLASGKRGALESLLRREGIYSSLLSSWRTQLGAHGAAGLAAKKMGRKPQLTDLERRNIELTKRNSELERRLHVANVLIALQKKAHEVLGLALPESDGEI